MQIDVFVVNAFTANEKGGNPAGVVLHADGLTDKQLLFIANKVGLSETAFVSKSNDATNQVRFFTPTQELDLCGHATIATWSLMYQQRIYKAGDYSQNTLAGKLGISINESGLVYMQQAKPSFYNTVERSQIAKVLGLNESDFNLALKPQVVSTGLRDLLVPLKNEQMLAKIKPDFAEISALSKELKVSGLHVFCILDNKESVAAARIFAPFVGIPEEAATGTSNGALLCYLRKYESLPRKSTYRIEQGKSLGKLSYIYGRFENDIVWVGGNATVIDKLNIIL